ncbi:MAG: hypothetical protein WC242_01695 [Candidatus Paceibacterota bacterium]|jgi:hypothetical protein
MNKQKSISKKEIVFEVGKNYRFDTKGAVRIAHQISIIKEREEKNRLRQCLNIQNN